MARRKRATRLPAPGRSSTGKRTKTNTRASASVTRTDLTGRPMPPTLRRSSRIRNAAIRNQNAVDSSNRLPRDSLPPTAPVDSSNGLPRNSAPPAAPVDSSSGLPRNSPPPAAPVDSSNGLSRDSPPPAAPVDATLRGLLATGPGLENLLDYLNEWDRRSLIYALPSFRDVLRHRHVHTRFTCQNHPDNASLKKQNPINPNQLVLSRDGMPRSRCPVPAHAPQGADVPAGLRRAALVRHRNCQGYALGYASDPIHARPHGEYFWVCEVCAHKAWERHTVLHCPRAVDLCLDCSRLYRQTHDYSEIDYCKCLWDQSEDKVHLCTDCRQLKTYRDVSAMLRWVRMNLMTPIHDPIGIYISDYIDENKSRGESTCICGMPVRPKIRSHVLSAPLRATFDELVRVCTHCHKHRFLTYNKWR